MNQSSIFTFYSRALFSEICNAVSYSVMFFRSRIKLLWYRLWIRSNQFHKSLDTDLDILLTTNDEQREKYSEELSKRRKLAHEKNPD